MTSTTSLSPLKQAFLALEETQAKLDAVQRARTAPIAIVGLSCRFPGANDAASFWSLLREGADAVREVPAERWDVEAVYDPDPGTPGKTYSRWGGFLDQVDQFDPQFFGIAPREALTMDPQQRLLLEVSWEALESGGLAPGSLSGTRTGVYVGVASSDYANLQLKLNEPSRLDAYYASGTAHSIASGRLSYVLGLQGPSLSVDTACSSSLVAVHLACQSLRNGECRMALAAGVNVILSPENTIAFSKSRMLSPDGRCKTFDASANGFVEGEGCGVVVLKRLSDAQADGDHILALIRGTALNQDGPSSGLTAPNGPAQQAVIREALANGGVKPAEVSYVEAHGTGTSLGDPIEVQALGAVLREGRTPDQPFYMGSVKTNVGHLEAAAGIAGLIKVVLALQHREIPPHLHLNSPNPLVKWEDIPVIIPAQLTPWPAVAGRRLAGLSSFGFSGTNAHVIIEEAPGEMAGEVPVADAPQPAHNSLRRLPERPVHALCLAAKSERALQELAGRFAQYLAGHPSASLPDVCSSANAGRAHFNHRLALTAESVAQARDALISFADGRATQRLAYGDVQSTDALKIAFLFTGQGSQYADMGRQLFETQPVFRAALVRCDEALRPHLDRSLLSVLYPSPGAEEPLSLLDETAYTQPALFALEVALCELWRSWGVRPTAVMGHSVGEYVAAHVAGVFSLEDGLKLIAARGRLMQALPREGEMTAVFADEARVAQAIQPYAHNLSIAAVNGPDNVVISGARTSVQAALRGLEAEGIKARRLNVSHAFHSPLIEPMLDAFERVAGEVSYAEPQLRLISNVTGKAIGAELTQPAYWRRHARAAVQFESSMHTLRQLGCAAFLEVGPNPTLTGMGQRCLPELDGLWLPSLRAGRSDWQQMLDSLAALYLRGANPDWAGFDRPYPRRRLTLPTYPYQRERCWIDLKPRIRAQAVASAPQRGIDSGASHPLLGRRLRSALTAIQYESQLDSASQSLLDDHRVFGMAVLPAAATVEMALAAANTSGMRLTVVEDLVIHEALAVPEGQACICQTVLEPESALSAFVKVFSLHEDGQTWQLHASSKVCATQRISGGQASSPLSLAEIQARCPEHVSADEHYRNLADHGLDFGPGLRGVRHMWRRPEGDEALAEVRLPEPQAAELGAYLIHPALLDACLQAVAAALPADCGTYLPVHLERFEYLAAPGAHVWSHARLRPAAVGNAAPEHGQVRETVTCDVRLLDDAGQTVAEVIGLHLKHAEREALRRAAPAQARQAHYDDWLYEIAWQPKPLAVEAPAPAAPGPDTQTIVEGMRSRLPALSTDRAILAHDGLIQELERLSVLYITNAFEQLGWSWQPGQRVSLSSIAGRLGVTDRYRRLLARLLEILEEEGILRRQGDEWRVEHSLVAHDPHADWSRLVALDSSSRAELTLIGRCGPQLAGVLRGEVDPLHLLFPNGSFEAAEQLYQASPFAQMYNSLAREAVSTAVGQWPTGRALRVLEIGAGTGGTTSYLLPILPAETTEYWFTDISPLFTARAQEKFAAYPCVRYQTLDIEKSPMEQGLVAGQFDLIVAANVIHATADLRQALVHVRQLLAPGGLFAMIEVSARQRWVDITFGLTDGWWRFTDDELRPAYPLLGVQQWLDTLAAAGFAGASALPGKEDAQGILSRQAILLARRPQAELSRQQDRPGAPGAWLILADAQGVGRQLAAALESQGQTSLVACAGPAYQRESDNRWQLNAAEPGQFSQLLSEAFGQGLPCLGVVDLWSLDVPAPGEESATTATAYDPQMLGCASALHLTQAMLKADWPERGMPRLWLVTRNAQPVTPSTDPLAVAQAPVWGLGNTIALEHPELRCTQIDLDCGATPGDIEQLVAELRAGEQEGRVAFRHGARHVARLARVAYDGEPDPFEKPAQRLETTARGTFDSLAMRPAVRRSPGAGEVEIEVCASGLNFRDVMNVLAMRDDPEPLGSECSGRVARVGAGVSDLKRGDAVIAIAPGSFGTYVTARAELAVPKPDSLSFEEAATLPLAFLTAHYALDRVAQITSADQVLIHAAAGGVGLAAVQLAQRAGAEIFATAGSPSKREYLKSLGVQHVMDSRSLDFAGEIMAIRPEGVSVVLNSLAGAFIPKSLSVLADGGRFLEIGKRDIWSAQQVAEFKPHTRYTAIDLAAIISNDPGLARHLLLEVLACVQDGALKPLPLQTFPLVDAANAFRYMAQARHIGKIVIAPQEREAVTASEDSKSVTGRIHGDATYLITGGLGGLGLRVAEWLVGKGARHLVLAGRSGAPDEVRAAIRGLELAGASVRVVQADVSQADQVAGMLAQIETTLPPLRGVIHAAGVLDDGSILQQDWQRFRAVMAPKADGAWHLHALTRGLPLDFFVLFSSAASLLGSRGQANHAAANAFLDALAHFRAACGLPALAVNWGAWSEIGAAALRGVTHRAVAQGVGIIDPQQGIQILEQVIRTGFTQIGVLPIDWPVFVRQFATGSVPAFLSDLAGPATKAIAERPGRPPAKQAGAEDHAEWARRLAQAAPNRRRALLLAYVQEQVGKVLGAEPAQLREHVALSEMGLDSLMAIELRNHLGQNLGLPRALPATLVFDYPSVGALADYLDREILPPLIADIAPEKIAAGAPQTPRQAAATNDAASGMLGALEELSDEEVDRLFEEKLTGKATGSRG